jgi:hypothetical protein
MDRLQVLATGPPPNCNPASDCQEGVDMKKIDWSVVKADYFAENLKADKDQPFTLKELSVRWKIAYKTIRNRSSTENWNDELRDRITEQQVEILQKVQDGVVETEVEIRQRQAQVARYLMDKALKRLVTISPEELTKKEAIELVKLGLGEERKALGFADKQEITNTMEIKGQYSVIDQIAHHQFGETLFTKLIEVLPAQIEEEDCN